MGDIDVNKPSKYGCSPLLVAAKYGHVKIVKMLLGREDIYVNKKDEDGKTVLMMPGLMSALWHGAALSGNEQVVNTVRLLLDRPDFNVNQQDNNGKTVLLLAADTGNLELVKLLLLREDIHVNQADKNGITSLHTATSRANLELVELLLGHKGIKLSKATKSGEIPLGMAMERMDFPNPNFKSIVAVILEQLVKPMDEKSTCIICFDSVPEVVLIPCGHQNLCGPCAHQWDGEKKGCPVDRIKISGILPLDV